jgi:L-alanine-DL-glutamate epimerase-like enolase superfamily enzyme
MERYDPSHIEEPINSNNVQGLAEVRRHVDVPILVCGPGAASKETVLELVKHQACDAVNVDLLRCGGFLETKRVAGVAEAGGILTGWHSTCAELGPFEAAKLHFIASTPSMEMPVDDSQHHIEKYGNVIKDEFKTINGSIKVPEGPGLGIEIDTEKIRIAHERWLTGKYKHGKPLGFSNPYKWKKC